MILTSLRLTLTILTLSTFHLSAQRDWTRFRGSDGNSAVQDDPKLPETWSTTKNVHWKADVPGLGWSGPIIWKDRVFLTTVVTDVSGEQPKKGLYLGKGRREIPAGEHQWWTYCFDIETGKILWKHQALKGRPKVGRHPKSTYASETPTTDGERLYALFGDHLLICYDFDGNSLWTHEITPQKTMADYGAAASPVVHNGQVIYLYDNQEKSYLASLDAKTGKKQWQIERDEKTTWATPLIIESDGRTEIITNGKKRIRSYDLKGNLLWETRGKMSNLIIPSPLIANDLIYVTSGYVGDLTRPVFAIKPGATGDISLAEEEKSNESIAWFLPKAGPYNTSPIVYRGLYYTLLDRGMMTAHDSNTGEEVYGRTRFPRGATFTAPPWAYNGKLFCLSEDGVTYVLEAGREFKLLHTNDLDEIAMAPPAIAQGKLFIRTGSKLYCLAKK